MIGILIPLPGAFVQAMWRETFWNGHIWCLQALSEEVRENWLTLCFVDIRRQYSTVQYDILG